MTDQSREYPSYERNAKRLHADAQALHWFMDNYIPDHEDRLDPRASPMLRPSLKGLPPAVVISAEFDPLVDENEAYAERLIEAGVACRLCLLSRHDPSLLHPGRRWSRMPPRRKTWSAKHMRQAGLMKRLIVVGVAAGGAGAGAQSSPAR